jgi:transposase-like protein
MNRTGFSGGSDFWKDGAMTTNRIAKPYPAELRERAVRLVREQEAEHLSLAAAIRSVAAKIGCSAETLRLWVRRAKHDGGRQGGANADERERLKALEREVRELRQANEILRKASAYFAQAELDRRSKP